MDFYVSLAKIWMIAGRNILFAGPPGTGKTRLAYSIAYMYQSISGYEGLVFRDLIVRYGFSSSGTPVVEPGPLIKAVLKYYMGLSEEAPVHIVFDEINRVNVETLFGPIFTALDTVHRMRLSVIDYASVLGAREFIEKEWRVQGGEVTDLINKCRDRGLDGLPLPYSTRFIATMNTYDVTQLYRIGYALQRRFAVIHIGSMARKPMSRVNVELLDKHIRETEKPLVLGEDMIKRYIGVAFNELLMHRSIPSLVEYDYSTIIDLGEELETLLDNVGDIISKYDIIWKALALIYSYAEKLGISLGDSFIVDAAKLVLVREALAKTGLDRIVSIDMVVDALASYILSQFHLAISRARLESILGNKTLSKDLQEFFNTLDNVLSEDSMTHTGIEALKRLLPVD